MPFEVKAERAVLTRLLASDKSKPRAKALNLPIGGMKNAESKGE